MEKIRISENSRILFIGDSITAQNRYVALIADHYKTNFPQEDIKFFIRNEYNFTYYVHTFSLW